KTADGLRWLTIPVHARNHFDLRIDQITTVDHRWRKQHWRSIVHSYSRAPYFKEYRDRLEHFYLSTAETRLSKINETLIRLICQILAIDTTTVSLRGPEPRQDKTERIIDICKERGADVHLFGPSARNYLHVELFRSHGLTDAWMSYDDYPEYRQ